MARILSTLTVAALFALNSPLLMAAEEEEEQAPEPVWVLSYASFLLFAGVTVFLCRGRRSRRASARSMEEQKRVGELRNARVKERRKRELYERVHAQKKK